MFYYQSQVLLVCLVAIAKHKYCVRSNQMYLNGAPADLARVTESMEQAHLSSALRVFSPLKQSLAHGYQKSSKIWLQARTAKQGTIRKREQWL